MPRRPRHKLILPEICPWHRLPDETDPAWAAFEAFRDMPPTREVAAVSLAQGVEPDEIARWAADHRWADRTQTWDGYQKIREFADRLTVESAESRKAIREALARLQPERPRLSKAEREARKVERLLARSEAILRKNGFGP